MTAAVSRLRGTLNVVYREMLKFGAVGAVAFVVDVGLFNLLTTDLWFGPGGAPLDGHEKFAKVISASVATVVAWLGNRYWSFRHRRQASRRREFVSFALMNVAATAIAVACLAVSHDLLGLTSKLADNVSGNIIGIGLGTLFRFWAYRTFVFTDEIDEQGRDREEDGEPLADPTARPLDTAPVDPGTTRLDARRADQPTPTPTPSQGIPIIAVPESQQRAAG